MRASSYHHQLTPSTKHCNEPVRRLKVIYHRCQPVLLPSPGRTHLKMMQTTIRCVFAVVVVVVVGGCCFLNRSSSRHLCLAFSLYRFFTSSIWFMLKTKKNIYIYMFTIFWNLSCEHQIHPWVSSRQTPRSALMSEHIILAKRLSTNCWWGDFDHHHSK